MTQEIRGASQQRLPARGFGGIRRIEHAGEQKSSLRKSRLPLGESGLPDEAKRKLWARGLIVGSILLAILIAWLR